MSLYSPDETFIERLEGLDSRLFAQWNNKLCRWDIMRKNAGKVFHIMRVQNDNGSYRPLDARTITKLKIADACQRGSVNDILRELDDNHERFQASVDREFASDVESIAKENWRHVMGHPQVNVPVQIS